MTSVSNLCCFAAIQLNCDIGRNSRILEHLGVPERPEREDRSDPETRRDMARKSSTPDLFETLRARGLRKRVARTLSDAVERAPGRKPPKQVERAVRDLRALVSDLEDRATGGTKAKRREAARKAAATRKRKAAKRSASAKKAAKTRARA
jgi:hypothetical protein